MGVDELILDRLSGDDVPEAQANLIIAALIGDDELARAASGESGARPVPRGPQEEDLKPKRT